MSGIKQSYLWLFAIALSVTPAVASAQAEEGANGPELYDFVSALVYGSAFPNASPAGANDWRCVPSAAHPRPVVLVHGTGENQFGNWAELSPRLKREGYCVFATSFGGYKGTPYRAFTDIAESAAELAAFVERVVEATGVEQVDIVGHSQGGMMPRYYIKELGGAARVHHLIGLAPSNYGTTLYIAGALAARLPIANDVLNLACRACDQQLVGSSFLRDLNAGGDTVPGVSYTVIQTLYDDIVTPFTNAFLRGPGVKNILLQEQCPLDFTDHLGIPYDPIAIQHVLNALDPSTARRPPCFPVAPVIS